MVTKTVPGAQQQSPQATTWVTFGHALQSFYTSRGMWAANRPRGELAKIVRGAVIDVQPCGNVKFRMTLDQIQALRRDVRDAPFVPVGGQAMGQIERRLREAAVRLGATSSSIPKRSIQPPAGGAVRPRAGQRSRPPAPTPFEPLQAPAAGAAKERFEERCMRTLREFVVFTQSSAYTGEPGAAGDGGGAA